jgi:hypothetical protein
MLAGEVWTRLEGRWEDELGMRRRRAVERTRKQISQCSESVDETERRNRGVEATGEQRTSRGICKVCRREREKVEVNKGCCRKKWKFHYCVVPEHAQGEGGWKVRIEGQRVHEVECRGCRSEVHLSQ